MRTFLALVIARNKEFYRDRSAMVWTIVFPLLLIVGFTFAFSRPADAIFKLGVWGDAPQLELPEYVELVTYQDWDRAVTRLRHHELDLLLNREQGVALYNELSPSSGALLDLLRPQLPPELEVETMQGKAVRYVEWAIPGVVGMNIMFGALFGVGYVIVRYRKNGVLKRLSAAPVSPFAFLSAQMLSRFMIVMISNGAILAGCVLMLDLRMEGSWLDLTLALAAGCLTMICIGLVVASRVSSEELAGGLLNVLSWPMMILSELWFSLDNAPQWMQAISNLLPLTHMVRAIRSVMVDGAGLIGILPNLLALGLFGIFSVILAAWLFRWEPGQ